MRLEKSFPQIASTQEGVGYAQLSLEILSCAHCVANKNCLITQYHRDIDRRYHLQENRHTINNHSHIYHENDSANHLYLISNGSVKSYILTEDGEEQVMNFYLAGDIIGIEALGKHNYITSTVALEKTTFCRIPLEYLHSEAVNQKLLDILTRAVMREHTLKLILAKKDADGRLASFLVAISNHYQAHHQPHDHFELSMTRQDIANYLGMAIETVSRTLRKFRDKNLIRVKRRYIQIIDFNHLCETAGTQCTESALSISALRQI